MSIPIKLTSLKYKSFVSKSNKKLQLQKMFLRISERPPCTSLYGFQICFTMLSSSLLWRKAELLICCVETFKSSMSSNQIFFNYSVLDFTSKKLIPYSVNNYGLLWIKCKTFNTLRACSKLRMFFSLSDFSAFVLLSDSSLLSCLLNTWNSSSISCCTTRLTAQHEMSSQTWLFDL